MSIKAIINAIATFVKPTTHQMGNESGLLGLGSRQQLETQRKLDVMHGALIMGDVETASRIRNELNLPNITGPL